MEKANTIVKVAAVLSISSVMIVLASTTAQVVTSETKMKGLSEEVGLAIAAFFVYILHQLRAWWKKRNEEREKAKIVAKSGIEFTHYIDLQVKHAINSLAKDYKFMRCFVMHFHNGDFTDAGLSLIKLTMKHEVTEYRTVKKVMEHYQGKPIPEIFYSMIRRVIKEGHYLLTDRESLAPDSEFYQWLSIYDVGSMLAVEIKDSKTRKIVAILCMQWRIKDGVYSSNIPQIKEDKKSIEEIYDTL
jgi:hypothetical protein